MATLVWIILTIYLHATTTLGESKNFTVAPGCLVSLPCATSLSGAVDWWYQTSATALTQHICINGEIVVTFKQRFSINSTVRGQYNLVIQDIQTSDAGLYTCIEDAGLGPGRFVRILHVDPAAPRSNNDCPVASTDSTTAYVGADEQESVNVAGIVLGVLIPLLIAAVALIIVGLYLTKKIELPCIPRINVTKDPEIGDPLLANSGQERRKLDPNLVLSVKQIQEGLESDVALINCIQREPLSKALLKSLLILCYFLPETTPYGRDAVQTLSVVCRYWWFTIDSLRRDKRRLRSAFKLFSGPYRPYPKLLHTMETADTALGVANIDDMIYVITKQSNLIKVFSSNFPYRLMPDIGIKAMKRPTDIVAWKPGKSTKLFVTDFKQCCIWRIKFDGEYGKWPIQKATRKSEQITKPCSLSVVSEGLAVVTAESKPIVNIYGPHGELKKKIPLTEDILWLYCGVTPQLSLITLTSLPECKALRPSSKDETFFNRFHVSFDNEGRCFCCDRARNCVYLLTSDLGEFQMILSTVQSDLKEPNKVCYVRSDGNLWICDQKTVKVFQVAKHRTQQTEKPSTQHSNNADKRNFITNWLMSKSKRTEKVDTNGNKKRK